MTIAIGHAERDGMIVLDALREAKPPFSPDAVCEEFVELLRRYDIRSVVGDKWGGQFVQEQFEKRGISYEPTTIVKSELYRELLPNLNAGRVQLLDHPRLVGQLCNLERRVGWGGARDVFDHPRGMHDDLANAAAGAVVLIANDRRVTLISPRDMLGPEGNPVETPTACDVLYACVASDPRGNVACVYMSTPLGADLPITIVDYDAGGYHGAFISSVVARLVALAGECHARYSAVVASPVLARHFEQPITTLEIPDRFDPAGSLIGVSQWCAEGKVRLSAAAMAKSAQLPFDVLSLKPGDPIDSAPIVAFIAACAVKMDETLV
jgi:hypothetical protein